MTRTAQALTSVGGLCDLSRRRNAVHRYERSRGRRQRPCLQRIALAGEGCKDLIWTAELLGAAAAIGMGLIVGLLLTPRSVR